MLYHIGKLSGCQEGLEVLSDKTAKGKERPWRKNKAANEYLALAYDELNPSKALRLRNCGTFLEFAVQEDGGKKLKSMNSCRVRLCPICTWRRSLKVHAHVMRILNAMDEKYSYLFLTLTVRNCKGDELSAQLDELMGAWHRFARRKQFQKAVKGWYRGLEITHNVRLDSPDYDTFHPHFHCLLAVNNSYFSSRDYLSQAAWTELWKESLRANYTPIVDVRRVKGNTSMAVAEAAKYAVKGSEYIVPEDWDLTIDTVRILDHALEQRRLVAFGGNMKELHKELNLDDEIDGDLVHIDDELEPEEGIEQVFFWHSGYQQYLGRPVRERCQGERGIPETA